MVTLFTRDGPARMMVRRLLAPVALLLLAVGWLVLEGARAGFFGLETGLVLFALASLVILSALVYGSALAVDRAETERRRADALFRTLVESAPDAVALVDRSGVIRLVNDQAEKLFGYERAALVGQPIEMLIPARFRSGHAEHRRGYAAAPRPRAMGSGLDLYGCRRDGTEFAVEISLSPVETEKGQWVASSIRDVTERKRVDDALRASETRFRTMVEGVTDYAILMLDPDGHVVSWNAGAERLKGYRADEIIGQSFSRFYPEEDVARGKPARELETAASEGRLEDEGWLVRQDGSRFWANVIIKALRDETGQLRGFSKITRDLTERRQADEALELERSKLIAAFENTNMGFVLSDGQGGNISMNAAALRFHGYKSVAEMHERVEEYAEEWELRSHDGRTLPFVEWPLPRAIRGESFRDCEIHLRKLESGYEWVCSYTGVPVRNSVGEVSLIVLTLLDITERKRAEEEQKQARAALARSEERFVGLIEFAPDAMVISNARGEVVLVNGQAERLFGYRREEMLGKPVEILVPERFRSGHPGHRKGYAAAPRTRAMGSGLDLYGCRRDGTEFAVEISLSPIETEEGQWVASSIRDVTGRKEAERVLSRTAESLARSNRELEEFTSIASHDLQEPLRKIVAFGDRLQTRSGEALSEEGRDYLDRMRRAATRMSTLIEDLLELSRVGTKPEPFQRVPLASVVSEALEDLEETVTRTGGRVAVGPLPTLVASRLQMRRLFQNLIGNALKFHKEGEPPAVSVESRTLGDGRFEIVVADNGIGFDEKYLDRVFRPFQRLHGRSEFEGTGMGLAICHKIVARHGGTLTASSRPGEGSRFVVTLPERPPAH